MTDLAGRYRTFAETEARGSSPRYEALSLGVAADPDLTGFLDGLPRPKQQPNLLLAAVRHLGGPTGSYPRFREFVLGTTGAVRETMLARATQTNEAARTSAFLPVLARLPQPLALLEVGASAGLCLYPDRYRYDYDGHLVGPRDSPVVLRCRPEGPVPLPERVPEVAWRAGIDLNPLDVTDPDDLRWLEALVWPEHTARLARLHAAAGIVRDDPPLLVRGDLVDTLADVAARAPAGATLVVFHSSVLYQLPPERRVAFADAVGHLDCRWLSQEAPSLLPALAAALPRRPPADRAVNLVGLDGVRPLGFAAGHGDWLDWF